MKRFSERERQILALAAEGLIDKEIARELGLSVNTLRTYWSRIRSKVGGASRSALVALYTRRGRSADPQNSLAATSEDWLLDIKTDLITASDAINEFYGLERGVAHPRSSYLSGYHPEDYKRVREAWTQIMTGALDSLHMMYRVVSNAGVQWVSVFAELKHDPQGKPDKVVGHRVASRNCVSTREPDVRVGFLRVTLPGRSLWLDDVSKELVGKSECDPESTLWLIGRDDVLDAVDALIASGEKRLSRDYRGLQRASSSTWLRMDLLLEPGPQRPAKVLGSVLAFE